MPSFAVLLKSRNVMLNVVYEWDQCVLSRDRNINSLFPIQFQACFCYFEFINFATSLSTIDFGSLLLTIKKYNLYSKWEAWPYRTASALASTALDTFPRSRYATIWWFEISNGFPSVNVIKKESFLFLSFSKMKQSESRKNCYQTEVVSLKLL